MVYDALEMRYTTLKIQRDPTQTPPTELLGDYEAFCGAVSEEAAEAAANSTISVATLDGWLKERADGGRDFVLVDVREPVEYDINRIPGSVLIPKGEFLNGSALEKLAVGQADRAALQDRRAVGRGAGHREGGGLQGRGARRRRRRRVGQPDRPVSAGLLIA